MDMSSVVENNDEDSFIILGTSPGTSLDIKCNGVENGVDQLDKVELEEAMKDLSSEVNSAFKAHFKLDTCPSPSSMLIASTIITDDRSTEDLQKQFGELLDENLILKETLKQNNDSIKEQFLLIASCQEDMMKTHKMHREKFEETKELVERLRQENKKLKQDIAMSRNGEGDSMAVNCETGEQGKSGPPSALEFVTSPDDDTIDKLTAQLELVEKQRRQVIVENEKLTWQKESLEHIVDATSKERDDLKEKLKNIELQLSTKDSHYSVEINNLKYTIQDLNNKLQAVNNVSMSSSDEINKRDAYIKQLDNKVSTLQNELRNAQLKILELESVKMESIKYKSGISDTMKIYKDQIQDLNNRLKEATTIMFQPVRISMNNEVESSSSDQATFNSNVKLYDRTLKHLAELFNILTRGLSDSLVQTVGVVASLQDFKLELCTVEQFQSGLADVRQQLEKQHSAVLNNIGQVRGTLTIFEGLFKDYNELLKKTDKRETTPVKPHNVEALTAALVARGQELQMLEAELEKWKSYKEDTDLLKAQIDLYKSDFEAEREAREKMASEKEHILTDLRTTQRRNEELLRQLDQTTNPGMVRVTKTKFNKGPTVGQSSTSYTPIPSTGKMVHKKKKLSEGSSEGASGSTTPPPLRYDCPVCDKPFKTLILLQQHVDNCLL